MIRAMQLLWRRLITCNREDSERCGDPKLPQVEKDFEIAEIIGKGRLGVVHSCVHRKTGQIFACKKMPATTNACHEMHILQNHLSGGGVRSDILKVKACYGAEYLGRHSWTKNVYMISELCDGGDLQHLLDRYGYGILSEGQICIIIKSLVKSLQYCHSCKIIHRDVKPSSIFMRSDNPDYFSWVFRLGNFDLSISKGDENVVHGNVGTLAYSAPEMLRGNGYSYEVDVWSAGVVLYVLLCGRTPFDAENESATSMYKKIQNTELDLSSGAWSSISDSAKELVLGMLQKDRKQRFSCYGILSHRWILGNTARAIRGFQLNQLNQQHAYRFDAEQERS